MTRAELEELRRMLRQRMRHAFGHYGHGQFSHADANLEGFLRELECFIDAKIADAIRKPK